MKTPTLVSSPFRYPGGKSWLWSAVAGWLETIPRPSLFIEPFAGGASITLNVIAANLAERGILVEKDARVAAFWQVALTPDGADWLARRIQRFEPTPATVQAIIESEPITQEDLAFQALIVNWFRFGGIMADRAGLINAGDNDRGFACRWSPGALVRRILILGHLGRRINVQHGDALQYIEDSLAWHSPAAWFIDPPYTAGGALAGAKLYRHADLDHSRLFALAARLHGPILLTYDDNIEVRRLAAANGLVYDLVQMRSNHHQTKSELVIARDVSWLDNV